MNAPSSHCSAAPLSSFFSALRPYAVLALVALAAPFPAPVTAEAALAEDSTVLSYLVDMQRRTGKGCNGMAGTPVGSVVPSEALRNIAEAAMNSGRGAGAVLTERGLGAGNGFSAMVAGATPQEALAQLLGNQCTGLMDPSLSRIGAVRRGNSWMVVMTQEEPRPLGQPQPSEILVVPEASSSGLPSDPAPGSPAAPRAPEGPGALLPYPVGPTVSGPSVAAPVVPAPPADPTVQPLTPPPSLAPLAPPQVQPPVQATLPDAAPPVVQPPTGHGGAANPHYRQGQDPIIARSATESLPADPVPTGVYSTGSGTVIPLAPGQPIPQQEGR